MGGWVCWAVVTLRGWGWRWVGLGWVGIRLKWIGVGLGWVDLDGFGRILFKSIEWIEFDLDCTGLFLFQLNKVNPTKQSRPSNFYHHHHQSLPSRSPSMNPQNRPLYKHTKPPRAYNQSVRTYLPIRSAKLRLVR